jgi:hypothetical protein
MVKEHETYLKKIEEAQRTVLSTTTRHLQVGNAEKITQFKEVLDDLRDAVQFCISVLDGGQPTEGFYFFLLWKKTPLLLF